jgi:hypothetical protein
MLAHAANPAYARSAAAWDGAAAAAEISGDLTTERMSRSWHLVLPHCTLLLLQLISLHTAALTLRQPMHVNSSTNTCRPDTAAAAAAGTAGITSTSSGSCCRQFQTPAPGDTMNSAASQSCSAAGSAAAASACMYLPCKRMVEKVPAASCASHLVCWQCGVHEGVYAVCTEPCQCVVRGSPLRVHQRLQKQQTAEPAMIKMACW